MRTYCIGFYQGWHLYTNLTVQTVNESFTLTIVFRMEFGALHVCDHFSIGNQKSSMEISTLEKYWRLFI